MKTIGYLTTLAAIILPLAGIAQGQTPDAQSAIVKDYGDFQLDQWI